MVLFWMFLFIGPILACLELRFHFLSSLNEHFSSCHFPLHERSALGSLKALFKTTLVWNKTKNLRSPDNGQKSPRALSLIESEGSRTVANTGGRSSAVQAMSLNHRIATVQGKAFLPTNLTGPRGLEMLMRHFSFFNY